MSVAKLRKEQLVELCKARGLDTDGRLKPELISMLKEHENNGEAEPEDSDAGSGSEHGGNSEAGNADEGSSMRIALARAEAERSRAETERLKMELELMRARADLGTANGAPTRSINSESGLGGSRMPLPVQADGEDPTVFFQAFEKVAKLQGIDEEKWARTVPSLFNSTLRAHYNRLNFDTCSDYILLKREILKAARLNAKFYLEKFKDLHRAGKDSYAEFLNKLSDVQRYYFEAKQITDFETLRDDMLLERFKDSLPVETRFFVDSRRPLSPQEAAEYADLHFDCSRVPGSRFLQKRESNPGHKPTQGFPEKDLKQGAKLPINGNKTRGNSNWAKPNFATGDEGRKFAKTNGDAKAANFAKKGACYRCGSLMHKMARCDLFDNGKAQANFINQEKSVISGITYQKQFVIPTYVNGILVEALRDSGSPISLLRADLCIQNEAVVTGNTVVLRGVFGKAKEVQTARVKIHSPKFGLGSPEVEIEVALVPNLANQMLLGCDLFEKFPQLQDPLITAAVIGAEGGSAVNENFNRQTSVMICTRKGRYGADIFDSVQTSEESDNSLRLSPPPNELKPDLTLATDMPEHLTAIQLPDVEHDEDKSIGYKQRRGVVKSHSTTDSNDCAVRNPNSTANRQDVGVMDFSDKQNDSDKEAMTYDKQTVDPDVGIDAGNLIEAANFKKAQVNDATLRDAFAKAAGGHPGFATFKGLLYRRDINALVDMEGDEIHSAKLVVPSEYRQKVLEVCHDSVWSGHFGVRKTKERLRKQFWWPTCEKQTAEYIRDCRQCQMSARRRVADRAPLCETPVVDTPFSEIYIDIMGEVHPTSTSGKRYILICVDAATNYIELCALSSLRAEGICKALVEIFARVGIPRRIRSDLGSHFKNKLVNGLQNLLGSTPIFSTAYHHESCSKAERFIFTLRSVLKRCIQEDGRNWDQILPMIAFAYREIPCSSSGFSPFELLYSHNVRGPTQILREMWSSESDEQTRSVAEYLVKTRERLKRCSELAHVAVNNAQRRAKEWYDKKSRKRELKAGDKVLVLLPTTENKLLSRWRGPYVVLKQLNTFNYEIAIGRRSTVLHINLLKIFHERDAIGGAVPINAILIADQCENNAESLPSIDGESDDAGGWQLGQSLSDEQRDELSAVLDEFTNQFGDKPGRTHLIQHKIRLTNETPINPRIYRIPDRLKDQVNDEIKMMLRDGIIEPSESSHVNPIVCVKRKGVDEKGRPNIRLCLDLRAINERTIPDEYVSSDMRALLDKCGAAKFKSSLDLNKAFMQVPLEKKSRPYCAFRSDFGFWQFCTLPFGAKNASKTFQRLINHVLRGAEGYCMSHVDDIIIFSNTWSDHLTHIHDVLSRLKAAGLVANPAKCAFARNSIKCLGHVLENGTIKPDPDKVKAIMTFPTPVTKKNVKSFLGVVNFYRPFINKCAEVAKPLTDLTRRDEPDKVRWMDIHEQSFKKLKECLCSEPVLVAPDPSKGYILKSDACQNSVAALLAQLGEDGIEHPVAYASQKLSPAQIQYSTTEKEFYGILFGLDHFSTYTYGAPIKVYTDHAALTWVNKMANHNSRLTRWALAMQKYDITEVRHVPGKNFGDIDGLSRAFCTK